ncbi:hypothetical protein [Cardinium endosymbiont of Nabis limbatus]|uniref:hypothetical protein n=1 Tax=Cardinium endosymbiont of Nabis limbatus TaxID=3066217 RepID=UPI003AF39FE7
MRTIDLHLCARIDFPFMPPMHQAFTSYRFFLLLGLFILTSGACRQNKIAEPVQSIRNDAHSAASTEGSIPFLVHQRPVGIPNVGGSCYINATLQVIAAFYPEEVMAAANDPLRTIIEKINHSNHLSIAESDIQLFIDSLPKMYSHPSNNGGDPVRFLDALDDLSPFLPKVSPSIRYFRQEEGKIKSCALKVPMPFILLYPPLDQGFQMETPCSNDLSKLIQANQANQEVCVYHDRLLDKLYKTYPLNPDKWNNVDCTPFVLKHQHLLGHAQGVFKPVIMQDTYSELPNKLAIAFTRPGSKGSATYDHSDLSGTEVIAMHHGAASSEVTTFRLAAFISAVTKIGPKPDHAIAFVQRNGHWYEVDDAIVTPIAHTEAIQASRQARILFYHKEKHAKPCNPKI